MKTLSQRICLSAAIALVAQFARADYLYCAIGDGVNEPTFSYNSSEHVSYDYATIVMLSADGLNNSGYLSVYESGKTSSSGITVMSGSREPFYVELPANYDTTYNTFLFELWTSGETETIRKAWQRYSLADAVDNIVKGGSASGGSPLAVASVIPEPTGGVLMLLGMAVLAIRRKDIKDLN